MQIKIQLVLEDEASGPAVVQELAQLSRDTLSPATLGMPLAEAKTVRHSLQTHIV